MGSASVVRIKDVLCNHPRTLKSNHKWCAKQRDADRRQSVAKSRLSADNHLCIWCLKRAATRICVLRKSKRADLLYSSGTSIIVIILGGLVENSRVSSPLGDIFLESTITFCGLSNSQFPVHEKTPVSAQATTCWQVLSASFHLPELTFYSKH